MVEAVKEHGTDKSACEAVKISPTTYKKVLERDQNFKILIDRAKIIYRYRKPSEQRDLALIAIVDRIQNGNRSKKVTRYRGSVTRTDRRGNIVYIDSYDRTTEVDTVTPASSNLISKLLPPSLEDSLKVVMAYGYIVINPSVKESESDGKGIPSSIADLILSDILGEDDHDEHN